MSLGDSMSALYVIGGYMSALYVIGRFHECAICHWGLYE